MFEIFYVEWNKCKIYVFYIYFNIKKRNILIIFIKFDYVLNFIKKINIFFVNDYIDEEKILINSVIINYKMK